MIAIGDTVYWGRSRLPAMEEIPVILHLRQPDGERPGGLSFTAGNCGPFGTFEGGTAQLDIPEVATLSTGQPFILATTPQPVALTASFLLFNRADIHSQRGRNWKIKDGRSYAFEPPWDAIVKPGHERGTMDLQRPY